MKVILVCTIPTEGAPSFAIFEGGNLGTGKPGEKTDVPQVLIGKQVFGFQ